MKTKLLLLLVLTYSGLMAQTFTSEYLFTNGDITNSVNSDPLTQTGTSNLLIDGIDGVVNNGMLLNGDAFNNPSWITDGGYNDSDYSIAFWIKTDENSTTEQEIINQYSTYGWKFTLINGNLVFSGKFFTAGTSASNQPATNTYTYNNIADDQWHFIVATLDKSAEAIIGGPGEYSRVRYKIYVDKVLNSNQQIQKVNVGNHYALPNNAQLFIGDNKDLNGNRYLDGIDNIRYYNGLLDQTEINNLYGEYFARAPITLFVNHAATGNNDGSSWADAYTNLQDAITEAIVIDDEIWIAQGTYIPDVSDKTKSFLINNSIKLYGGFDGTETQLSERDSRTNETILSGDLNNNDTSDIVYNHVNRTDNTYRVVVLTAENTLLDGLTISNGNGMHGSNVGYQRGAGIYKADYINSINLKNCTIKNNVANYATGLYAEFSTNATVNISKCIFENNIGRYSVAYLIRSMDNTTDVSIDNSLFVNNIVENLSNNDGYGGSAGMLSVNSATAIINATISNCTIADNVENGTHSASVSPGVLATTKYNGTLNTNIYNTIFWNNSRIGQTYEASSLGRLNAANFSNTLNFTHNLIYATSSIATINSYGTTVNQSSNVINHDPQWISNTGISRYRLTTSSLGYNSGDNTKVANEAEGDLAGQVRISEGTVDMGAFESESSTLSVQSNILVSTTVFPNPTTDYVNIKSKSTISLVTIYSATGKVLSKIKNKNKIDLSTLPSGIYFLSIELDNQSVVKKIMKY